MAARAKFSFKARHVSACARADSHSQVDIRKGARIREPNFKICSTGFQLEKHTAIVKKTNLKEVPFLVVFFANENCVLCEHI